MDELSPSDSGYGSSIGIGSDQYTQAADNSGNVYVPMTSTTMTPDLRYALSGEEGGANAPVGNSSLANYVPTGSASDLSGLAKFISDNKGLALGAGALAGLMGAGDSKYGKTGYQGTIPRLAASRTMVTAPPTRAQGYRPGAGGIDYGGDVTYTRMPAGTDPWAGLSGTTGTAAGANLTTPGGIAGGTTAGGTNTGGTNTGGTNTGGTSGGTKTTTTSPTDWRKGMSDQQYLDAINQWLATNQNANKSDIAAAMAKFGVSATDLQTALGQSKMSVADKYALTHGMGFAEANAQQTAGIKDWLAKNPYATAAQIAEAVKASGVDTGDINQALTGSNVSGAYKSALTEGLGLNQLYKNILDYQASGHTADEIAAAKDLYKVSDADIAAAQKFANEQKYTPQVQAAVPEHSFSDSVKAILADQKAVENQAVNENLANLGLGTTDKVASTEVYQPFDNTDYSYMQAAEGGYLKYDAGGSVQANTQQLSPEELTAQLQAYKANAPTTAEDFAKQQGLWSDYANRYANSSWDYANMGGKAQDYSLKPAEYLHKQVTGYSDPINQFMSETKQNTPTYSMLKDILAKKPEVNEAFKTVLASNPDAFRGGSGVIEATIRNLSADLGQFGTNTALKHFYQDQQNLTGLGTDNWLRSHTMDNPHYESLQKQIMGLTERVDDPAWKTMAKKGIGQNNIKAFWRDPQSGLGIGSDPSGTTLMYFDRDGRPLSSSVASDLAENARKYGIDLSGFAANKPQGYAVGGMAKGRYLQGETDGMADELPAQIGNSQPAALSHGEFVIPADVVSHMGNGNSDAGAKKLYQMMDKIRMARTGTKKQGKKINPDKFMPGGLAASKYAKGGDVKHFLTGGTTGTSGVGAAANAGVTGVESNLSNWAGDYVTNMLGQGQALANLPYTAYMGPLTAGESPLQTGAFQTAAGLTTPSSIGTAATNAGNISTAAQGLSYSPTTTTFGKDQATAYMNPYLEAALKPQLEEARRQSQITQQQNASQMTKAGAFGGGRQAILDAETQRSLGANLANITGTGYNTAYDKAMTQFNADQARKAQENQFGATYGLQGLQTGLQAAQTQGNLGATEAQTGLANLKAQLDAGTAQRGIESEGIAADKAAFEEARANPYKMVQFQQSLLQGLPLAAQSYNLTQPSTLSNIGSGVATANDLLNVLLGNTAAKKAP